MDDMPFSNEDLGSNHVLPSLHASILLGLLLLLASCHRKTLPTVMGFEKIKIANPDVKMHGELHPFDPPPFPPSILIYIFLEGVEQEKIDTLFKPTSIDVKFHDVDGKNYRCAIPKLNKEILPEKCKVLVKPKRVIITLPKASKGNWLDLHAKEDTIKPSMDKDKDPMAGIMDLMKNMYEEGDDDMKRMIAKSWSEARTGKAADPLKGFN